MKLHIDTTPAYSFLPKWMSNSAIGVYLVALLSVTLLFMQYAMEWYFMLIGIVEVCAFFYFSNKITKEWGGLTHSRFEKYLFWWSFGIRFVYLLFSWWFYGELTGTVFDFHAGDSGFYHSMAIALSERYEIVNWNIQEAVRQTSGGAVDFADTGYPFYLSLVYYIFGPNVFVARLIKCIISAWTTLIMYRLSARNFGDQVGRMTGVLCMLMPNLIHYCGMHLKETEMVFLTVVAIDMGDQIIRERRLRLTKIIPMLACMFALFAFRTVLALVVILAFLCAITLTSSRIVSWGKRILMILLAIGLIGTMIGGRIETEVKGITSQDIPTSQNKAMGWRAVRDNGNTFAKYAGAAVFAPLIFTLPFPTMTAVPLQENQRMIHGGNFVKNILSGFVIFGLLILVLSGDWRQNVLIGAVYIGYLIVLVFSNFAQAERFHMPIIPFMLMFAAYGISRAGKMKHRRWFNLWLAFIFVANIAWAWFKLRGRGM